MPWIWIGNIHGERGSIWYSGIGFPSDSIGVSGDWYIDTSNGNYYTKDIDTWVLVGNLQGPSGAGAAIVTNTPVETPNGTLTVFTVPEEYVPGSLSVFLNGLRERYITEIDTTTFEFDEPPIADDIIDIMYSVPA